MARLPQFPWARSAWIHSHSNLPTFVARTMRSKWVFVPSHAVVRTIGDRSADAGADWNGSRVVPLIRYGKQKRVTVCLACSAVRLAQSAQFRGEA
jgi:hypothetical protein